MMLGRLSDELEPDDPSPEQERLRERMSEVENSLEEPDSKKDRFLDIAEELDGNFEEYGNDFYHGTWGESADNIMESGIQGTPEGTRLSGETGTQNDVSLTSVPSWAVHYSLDQDPNTMRTIVDFVNRKYDFEPENREELSQFVQSLDSSVIEDEENAYNAKILNDIREETYDFQTVPERINEGIPVHEVVFGIDYDSIADQNVNQPSTSNEIKAIENDEYRSIGEVKVSGVSPDDLTAYVPHEFLDHYREEHSSSDIEIKSYDSLMLKHELEMEDLYREKGTRNLQGFWKGDKLGVEVETEEWSSTPYVIDISY